MQDVERGLRELLSELPEKQQAKVVWYVKSKILKSYQNGQIVAKGKEVSNGTEKPLGRFSRQR